MTDTGALPAEAMEVLERVSTGMVIDALAMAGIQGGIIGIWPVRGFEDAKVIGVAATAQFAPPRADSPKMTMYGVAREAAPGSVLVVDAAGRNGHFVGDNVAAFAKRQGVKGIVVYGGVRDGIGLREVGVPIYSSAGLTTRQPNNMQLTAQGVPVSIGEVLVRPGDIIFADEDGVVAIPANALEAVLQNMRTIFDVEEGMARAIENGASVEEIATTLAKKKVRK
jgi:4-hydroxy-4-methyl-2-oxoglutarate aldolase